MRRDLSLVPVWPRKAGFSFRSIACSLIPAIALTHFFGCSTATTRDFADPTSLEQDVGEEVVIYTTDDEWISGVLVSVGDDHVVLLESDQTRPVAFDEIDTIARVDGFSTSRTLLFGGSLAVVAAVAASVALTALIASSLQ